VWDLLQDENEEWVRRAVEFAERASEGREDAAERAAIYRGLRGHPIIHADAGWDLADAAVPGRSEPAAVEFAVLASELAFREPVDAKAAARFAAWAEATRTFLASGPANAAARLAENAARVRAAGLAAWAASIPRRELHHGGWEWVPDEANGHAVLAALVDARKGQSELLRELFGPPRPVTADPAWLAWGGGTVRLLTESILHEQAFGRMPVLGDALEDAGCADAAVLAHCRGPGPHTRWCWVVAMLACEE
jgi:hypothetical protein